MVMVLSATDWLINQIKKEKQLNFYQKTFFFGKMKRVFFLTDELNIACNISLQSSIFLYLIQVATIQESF